LKNAIFFSKLNINNSIFTENDNKNKTVLYWFFFSSFASNYIGVKLIYYRLLLVTSNTFAWWKFMCLPSWLNAFLFSPSLCIVYTYDHFDNNMVFICKIICNRKFIFTALTILNYVRDLLNIHNRYSECELLTFCRTLNNVF
jgi:hypothetical protein